MINSRNFPPEITSLTRNRGGGQGRRIIAHFDFEFGGVHVCGCTLLRTDKDGITIAAPRFDTDNRRRVEITDCALRHEITQAAARAYRALGGNDLPAWADKESVEKSGAAPTDQATA